MEIREKKIIIEQRDSFLYLNTAYDAKILSSLKIDRKSFKKKPIVNPVILQITDPNGSPFQISNLKLPNMINKFIFIDSIVLKKKKRTKTIQFRIYSTNQSINKELKFIAL